MLPRFPIPGRVPYMGQVYNITHVQQGTDDWLYTLGLVRNGHYHQHVHVPGRRLVAEMGKVARYHVEQAVDIGVGRKLLVIGRRWDFREGRVRYTLNTPRRERQDVELWQEELMERMARAMGQLA